MLVKHTIIPGQGYGPLIFGIYPEKVIDLLGIPENDFITEEGDRIFNYSSLGIKIACFEESEDFKLVSLEIDKSTNALFWETNIFDCSINEICKIFNQKGLSLSFHQVFDELQLSCHKLAMDFYFECNNLQGISFNVLTGANDSVLWP
jgi:hypothetical protein